jgi:hypothetical protein
MTSCWICLDDEPDQFGKPPVRDCSCRGTMLALPTFRVLLNMLGGKANKRTVHMNIMNLFVRGENALFASSAMAISLRSN